ncbi:MAG: tight adherence protein B, partial [Gammaproteobacteria bacterium]
MATLSNIAGGFIWLIVIVTVFAAAALFMYVAMLRGQKFMTEYKSQFTETASSGLADMFSFADPAKLFYINLIAVVVIPLVIGVLTGNWTVALIIFGLLFLVPNILYKMGRNRRYKKFERQLPDGLAMISGSMRAGA